MLGCNGLNGKMVGKIITLVYNCVSNSEHIHVGMHMSFTMENDDDNIEHNDFFKVVLLYFLSGF